MKYHFNGQERLQLWMDSPNHCATLIAMVLVICVGILAHAPGLKKAVLRVALSLLAVPGTLALVLTYSRGGWAAYAAGLGFLGLTDRRARRTVLLAAAVFATLVLLAPEGASRTGSFVNTEDRSILNRLTVWRGAAAIAAGHPAQGVGYGNFGTVFTAWYQPPEMSTKYLAALNNFLTLSAERGLLFGFAALFAFLFPVVAVLSDPVSRSDRLMVAGASCLVVYLVSSQFTYSLVSPEVSGFAGLVWLGVVARLGLKRFRHPLTLKVPARWTGAGAGLVTGLTLAIGLQANATADVEVRHIEVGSGTGRADAVLTSPRYAPVKGIIVYLPDKDETLMEVAQKRLRHLSGHGFQVLSMKCRPAARDSLEDAVNLVRWAGAHLKGEDQAITLCGYEWGGQLALLAAARSGCQRVKTVLAINAETDWPFADLSPLEQLPDMPQSIRLVYLQEKEADAGDLGAFSASAVKNNKDLKVSKWPLSRGDELEISSRIAAQLSQS